MSTEASVAANKEALRRAASIFGPERFEEYLKLYAEDARLHFLPPGLPPGRAGARVFYGAIFDAFENLRLTIDDMVGEGDQVGLRFSLVGTHRKEFLGVPASNREVQVSGVTIFRFANGECVERWSQSNLLAVLQRAVV